jgi:fibronectin type 3 domain-containing protein
MTPRISAAGGGKLAGPQNLRANTPHSVTLAWDAAVNSGSFTYVIRDLGSGYQVGAAQTQTSYTWTRDMYPGRTYSFVAWAADAKGHESARSNILTVTLPVDTTPPAAPVVTVTGTTSSTVGLAWDAVADDDSSCCTYRVYADGLLANVHSTGERSVTVLRLSAATIHTFTVVAVDPSHNVSPSSAPVTATTLANLDTTPPTAPGLVADNIDGCETWLSFGSVDDVDPDYSILYEVWVNGVFDGAQLGSSPWITYGTDAANTYSVQAVDSAGNRSPVSSVVLVDQTC